jgi:hypothetical protein
MAFFRALVVIAGTLATVSASAAQLYWIDDSGIKRANLDGSGQQQVVSSPANAIFGMAVDVGTDTLYWTNGAQITRAHLDGTSPQTFITPLQPDTGMFVHPTTHELWWAGRIDEATRAVFRTSSDGLTTVPVFVEGGSNSLPDSFFDDLNGFFIDAAAGKFYKLDVDDDQLSRVNFDSTNLELLAGFGDDDRSASSMAFDLSSGKVYYAHAERVFRDNLDGTGDETLLTLSGLGVAARTLAFDASSSTFFFGNPAPATIYRMSVDGSAITPIASAMDNFRQLLLVQPVPEPSTLAMLLAALPLAYFAYRRR